MRLSNLAIFLVLASAVSIGLQGCKWWDGDSSVTPSNIPEPKSRTPYPAKEPERYRAIVAVRAGEVVRRAAIAKDGTALRIEFELGTDRSLIMLRTDRVYVISDSKKIYTEKAPGTAFPAEEFISELTSRLLHRRENAEIEALGYENELAKYRVVVNGSETSESIVYVDEKLGMPVVREFYSINGELKELTYRMELQEVSLEVDRNLFQVPKDYKKVAAAEFYRLTRNPGK
jgi:hypothetical protein